MSQSCLAIWSDEKARAWIDPKTVEWNTVVVASAQHLFVFFLATFHMFLWATLPCHAFNPGASTRIGCIPSARYQVWRITLNPSQGSDLWPRRAWEICGFSWGCWERGMCSFLMDLNQGQRAQKREPTEWPETSSFCAVGGGGMFSDTQLSTMWRGSA